MNASNSRSLTLRKPRPTRKAKVVKRLQVRRRIVAQSAQQRKEKALVAKVFAEIEERDGLCKIDCFVQSPSLGPLIGICGGDSTPAHLSVYRRSRTRGWPAENRHSPMTIIRLCQWHHRRYDQHEFELSHGYGGGNGPVTPVPFVKKGAAA